MSLEKFKSIDCYVWMFVARQFAEYINKKEEQYNGPVDWVSFPEKMKDRVSWRLLNISTGILTPGDREILDYAKRLAHSVAVELITTAGFLK